MWDANHPFVCYIIRMSDSQKPLKAAWMLILATVFWGLSFLSMKALVMVQQQIVPGADTWFLASLSVIIRFGVSAVIILLFSFSTIRHITRSEIWQGLGLGIIGGIGLLVQMDGVNYTAASTSAFLTQCYCLFIPVIVTIRERRLPSPTILIGSVMVLGGVAVLSRFDFKEMRMGRGEWETLVATLFFTAQILWLERKKFSANRPNHFSVVMFATTAIVMLPVQFLSKSTAHEAMLALSTPPTWLFAGILTLLCTTGSYTIMNFWQPHIDASKAGLIYCAEPVFASLFALFLPAIFSHFAKIDYPNEHWTFHLIVGGGLITAANIFIMVQTARSQKKTAEPAPRLEPDTSKV